MSPRVAHTTWLQKRRSMSRTVGLAVAVRQADGDEHDDRGERQRYRDSPLQPAVERVRRPVPPLPMGDGAHLRRHVLAQPSHGAARAEHHQVPRALPADVRGAAATVHGGRDHVRARLVSRAEQRRRRRRGTQSRRVLQQHVDLAGE